MQEQLQYENRTFITTTLAAEMTGYSSDYVGQLAREGHFESTKIGRRRFIDRDEFLLYADENKKGFSIANLPKSQQPESYESGDEEAEADEKPDSASAAAVTTETAEDEGEDGAADAAEEPAGVETPAEQESKQEDAAPVSADTDKESAIAVSDDEVAANRLSSRWRLTRDKLRSDGGGAEKQSVSRLPAIAMSLILVTALGIAGLNIFDTNQQPQSVRTATDTEMTEQLAGVAETPREDTLLETSFKEAASSVRMAAAAAGSVGRSIYRPTRDLFVSTIYTGLTGLLRVGDVFLADSMPDYMSPTTAVTSDDEPGTSTESQAATRVFVSSQSDQRLASNNRMLTMGLTQLTGVVARLVESVEDPETAADSPIRQYVRERIAQLEETMYKNDEAILDAADYDHPDDITLDSADIGKTTSDVLSVSGRTTFSATTSVDTDTLFVDVTNDRVGINTDSPQYALDVVGTFRADTFVANSTSTATNFTASSTDTGSLTADTATITNLTGENATFTSATTTNFFASVANFTTAVFDTITATLGDFTNLEADNATTTNLVATDATTTNLTASSTDTDTLTAGDAVFTNSTTTNAYIQNLLADNSTTTNAYIEALTASSSELTEAGITDLTTTNATTANSYIQELLADNSTTTNAYISNLVASSSELTEAEITDLVADNATTTNAYIASLMVDDLEATNATFTNATSTDFYTQLLAADDGDITNLTGENATFTSATTTNFFASVANFTTAVFDTITATLGDFTNLEADNATTTNLVATDATTTNLTASSTDTDTLTAGDAVFTNATTTNFVVLDDTVFGDTELDTLTVNATIESDLIPNSNATLDLGSPSFYWDTAYLNTINANNISAASTSISGTDADSFTLNTDNSTQDEERSDLIFYRGQVTPNAVIEWDNVADRFDFNQSIYIDNDSNSTTNPTIVAQATPGQTADLLQLASSSGDVMFSVGSDGSVTAPSASTTDITGTNATFTSATTTNFFASVANFTTAVFDTITATLGDFTNLEADNATTTNLTASGDTDLATTTAGSLTLQNLTNERLLSLNASGGVSSSDLIDWLNGTTDQVSVVDNGDGTVTLTLPQDIATGSAPTFDGMTLSGLLSFTGTDHAGIRLNALTDAERNALTAQDGMIIFNETESKVQAYTGSGWENVGSMAIGEEVELATSGSVLFVDASGNLAEDNANFYWDDTNDRLGIGTTSPAVALDIDATDAVRLPVGTSAQRPTGENGFIRYNSDNSQFEGFYAGAWQGLGGVIDVDQDTYITAEESSDEDYLRFYTAGSERMTVTDAGDVGIGTGSPGAALDVQGDEQINLGLGSIYTASGGNYDSVRIKPQRNLSNNISIQNQDVLGGSDRDIYTQFYSPGGEALIEGYQTRLTFRTAGGTNDPIMFQPGTSESVRFNADGTVGIGTTTPNSLLDVAGTTTAEAFAVGGDTISDFTGSNLSVSSGVLSADPNDSVEGSELDNLFSQNGFLERTGAGTYQATSTIDISDDTNLSASDGATLTGDAISVDNVETLSTGLTAGSIAFSDGSTLAEDNANFFWDDTNNRLGIGTTSPATALDVAGNVQIDNSATILNSGVLDFQHSSGDSLFDINAGSGSVVLSTGGSANFNDPNLVLQTRNNQIHLRPGDQESDPPTTLAVSADGEVGINTESPSSVLDIRTEVQNQSENVLRIGDDDHQYGFDFRYTGTQTGDDNGLELWTDGETGGQNTNRVFRVLQSGNIGFDQNVGIGTTSPATALDVEGDITADNYTFPADGGIKRSVGYDSGNDTIMFNTSGGAIAAIDNGDWFFTASDNNGGQVGIGDRFMDAHLEVSANGGAGGDIFLLSSDDNNDGDIFTVTEAGNVGVGTTSPTTILDVAGTTTAQALAVGGDTISNFTGSNLSVSGGVLNATDTDTQLTEDETEAYIFDADNTGTLSSGTLALDSLSYTGSLSDAVLDDDLTISSSGSVADGALSSSVSLLGQNIEDAEIDDIETLSTGLTAGSIAFSDGSTLAQNNANFFWDDANNRLGIGTNSPSAALDIQGSEDIYLGAGSIYTASGGSYDSIRIEPQRSVNNNFIIQNEDVAGDSSRDILTQFYSANGEAVFEGFETQLTFQTRHSSGPASADPIIFNPGTVEALRLHTDGTATIGTTTMDALTVGSDTITDFTGSGLSVAANILSVDDVETLSTSLATGSVAFSDGSTLAEDNANFFWDDTNDRLGIGTTTPTYALDVDGTFRTTESAQFDNGAVFNVAGSAGAVHVDSDGSSDPALVIDRAGQPESYSFDTEFGDLNLRNESGTGLLEFNDETTALTDVNIAHDNSPALALSRQTDSTTQLWTTQQDGGFVGTLTSDPFTIQASSTDAITVEPSGNVGVGVDNPSSALQVGEITTNAPNNLITVTGYDDFGMRFNGHNGWTDYRIAAPLNGGLQIYNEGSSNTSNRIELGQPEDANAEIEFATENNDFIRVNTNGAYDSGKIGVLNPSDDYAGDIYIDAAHSVDEFSRFTFNGSGVFESQALDVTSTTTDSTIAGNLGIGTDSPSAPLHILNSGSSPSPAYGLLVEIDDQGQIATAQRWHTNDDLGRDLDLNYLDQPNSWGLDSGSYGFNIEGSFLSINGESEPDGSIEDTLSIMGNAGTAGGEHGSIGIRRSGSAPSGVRLVALQDGGGDNDDYGLGIFTHEGPTSGSPTEKVRISGNGNVGIGTTSPDSLLDVDGTAQLRGSTSTTGLVVDANGNVGAGINNPSQELEVASGGNTSIRLRKGDGGSTNSIQFSGDNNTDNAGEIRSTGLEHMEFEIFNDGQGGSADFKFIHSSTELLRITDGGAVGIGTTSPATTLDVAGTTTAQAFAVGGDTITDFTGDNLSVTNGVLNAATGGSGEANDGTNLGTGAGWYGGKSGTDLEFKSAVAGSNVSISTTTDEVTISSTQLSEADAESYIFDGDNTGTLSSGTLDLSSLSYTGSMGIGNTDLTAGDLLSFSGSTLNAGGTEAAFETAFFDVVTPAENNDSADDLSDDTTDDLAEGSTNLYSQWGESGTDIFYTGGNVGIGTNGPSALLEVSGSGSTPRFRVESATSGVYALEVDEDDKVTVGTGNDDIYFNTDGGTMVGIGTSSPATTLDVAGTTTAEAFSVGGDTITDFTGTGLSVASNILSVDDVETLSTGLTAGSIAFSDGSTLSEDNSNFFWDDTNDRLGIGTDSPEYDFSVGGFAGIHNNGDPTLTLTSDADFTGNYIVSSADPGDGNAEYLQLLGQRRGTDVGAINIQPASGGSSFVDDSEITFSTKQAADGSISERMRIDSSGNVGIGTTTPGNALSVAGDANVTGDIGIGTNSPDGELHIADESPVIRLQSIAPDDYPAIIFDEGPIGNSGGAMTLQYSDIANALQVRNDPPGDPGSDIRLHIDRASNLVGIGNDSPSNTLDVSGGIDADTLNTGQGDNELYAMDQAVQTTDTPTFAGLSVGSDTITDFTGTGLSVASNVLNVDDVETLNTSLTSGSIVFSDGSSLAQDNANFFWDSADSRLGIGTNGPSAILEVSGSGSTPRFRVESATSGTYALEVDENDEATVGTGNGHIFLDTSGSTNVGIGTSTPSATLTVDGDITGNPDGSSTNDFIFGSDQTGDSGNASQDNRFFYDVSKGAFRVGTAEGSQWNSGNIGDQSMGLGFNTTASGLISTAIGYNTTASGIYSTALGGSGTASGDYSLASGYLTTASGTSTSAFGYETTASGNYSTVFGRDIEAAGDYSFAVALDGNQTGVTVPANSAAFMGGNVGFGTTTPGAPIDVAGAIRQSNAINCELASNTSGDIICSGTSDENLKTDINNLQSTTSLAKINQLQGKTFKYLPEAKLGDQERIGFIAQDVEKIFPELVGESNGHKFVDYDKLTAVLAEAVQELDGKLATLKSEQEYRSSLYGSVDNSATTSESTPTSLAAAIGTWLSDRGVEITDGVARFVKGAFDSVTTSRIVIDNTRDEDDENADLDPAAGSGEIPTDEDEIEIENNQVATSSQVLITFTSEMTESWWVEKKDEAFSLHTEDPVAATSSFDYLIIGVEQSEEQKNATSTESDNEDDNTGDMVEIDPGDDGEDASSDDSDNEDSTDGSNSTTSPETDDGSADDGSDSDTVEDPEGSDGTSTTTDDEETADDTSTTTDSTGSPQPDSGDGDSDESDTETSDDDGSDDDDQADSGGDTSASSTDEE